MAFRSISTTTYASRTNNVITPPAGIVDGDILLLYFITGLATTAPTATPPAGFTAIPGPTLPVSITTGGFNVRSWCWYKVAASESGSYTVTHATASSQGYLACYSGRNTGTPFDLNPVTNNGTGTTRTWTGQTTVTNGADVILVGHDWGDTTNNLVPPTGTTPTFTEQADAALSYWCDGTLATAGATGSKTQTCNSNSLGLWDAYTICLRPAAAAAFRAEPNEWWDGGAPYRQAMRTATL